MPILEKVDRGFEEALRDVFQQGIREGLFKKGFNPVANAVYDVLGGQELLPIREL